MALKADLPDAIDSGGPKNIGIDMVMNDIVPLVLGTLVAAVVVVTGLGAFETLKPTLSNVPVVGQLLNAGGGDNAPAGWGGL